MSNDTIKSLLDSIDKYLDDVEHGRRGHYEEGATYARADLAVLKRKFMEPTDKMIAAAREAGEINIDWDFDAGAAYLAAIDVALNEAPPLEAEPLGDRAMTELTERDREAAIRALAKPGIQLSEWDIGSVAVAIAEARKEGYGRGWGDARAGRWFDPNQSYPGNTPANPGK